MKEARKRRHKNGHDNSKINYEISQSEQFLFPNIRKLSQALGELLTPLKPRKTKCTAISRNINLNFLFSFKSYIVKLFCRLIFTITVCTL